MTQLPFDLGGGTIEREENPWDMRKRTVNISNNDAKLDPALLEDMWQDENEYVMLTVPSSGRSADAPTVLSGDEWEAEGTCNAHVAPDMTSNGNLGHSLGSGHVEESAHWTSDPLHMPSDGQVEKSVPHSIMSHGKSTPYAAIAAPDDKEVKQVDSTPVNVIVFGESGVGKSSIINMLVGTGEREASVSNQAVGCTFASADFRATIADREVVLYDTAGLNEAEAGTVSPKQAIKNLSSLVRELKTVNLLVHCIRGTRFRRIVANNYRIFCNTICGGDSKVPVVLVITGLENEDNMDDWWENNKAYFDRYELEFCGHACITATRGRALRDGSGYIFQDLYDASKQKLVDLLTDHAFGSSITIVPPKDTSALMPEVLDSLNFTMLLSSLREWTTYFLDHSGEDGADSVNSR